MPRFDFQSPGAAFAGGIADVLVQRKAEERQRMLDQLNVNADKRAAEASAQQAEMNKIQMAEAQQRQELAELNEVIRNMPRGTVPTNPKHAALLERWGKTMDLPTPQVSTETQFTAPEGATLEPGDGPQAVAPPPPPAPPRRGFVGTQQEQEQDRLRVQSANLIKGLMQDPSKKQVGEFLARFAEANDGVVPGELVAKLTAPDSPIAMFDEPRGRVTVGGKPVDALPPNARVINKGYGPSSMYTNPADRWFQTADGFVNITPKGPVLHKTDINNQPIPGIRTAPNAGGANAQTLGIPAGVQERMEEAAALLGVDPRSVDETALANYRGAAAMAIMNAGAQNISRNSRTLAIAFIKDYNSAKQFAGQMLKSGQLTEQEINDSMLLIEAVAPPHIKEILLNNPYKVQKEDSGWLGGIFGR